MLCRICGTPIKAGERFCSLCGTKAETTEDTYQDQAQQQYSRQTDSQQPYGQQSYRSEDTRQSYRQQESRQGQPYGQYSNQPYGRQQRSNMYYSSETTTSKKWLWITLSLVAVIAVAAVLIFFMPVRKPAGVSQVTPPFKGDTIQTRFANDTAKVVSDALAIFGDIGIDVNGMAEKPFDMKMDLAMEIMGQKISGNIDMAYDNETLGMNINAEGTSAKILLIDDMMYMETLGKAYGFDFNSSEDLLQPMTLRDRITKLTEGTNLTQSTSSEDSYTAFAGLVMQNMQSEGEYTALAELLLNSIDESCFESSDNTKTTLTLHTEDIAATLRTFAKKLEDNEELKEMVESLNKFSPGASADIIEQINDIAEALEEQKDTLNIVLVWEVSYKNEKPVSFEIKANDGAEEYVYSYGYEQKDDSTDITFEIIPGNASVGISGTCNFKKAGSGTEFVGTLTESGQQLSIPGGITLTFYGNIAFSGNNTRGTITINVPNAMYNANGLDMKTSIDFNMTVNIGMPAVKVKDDGRFSIDTSGATVIDGSAMLNPYGLQRGY